MTETIEYEQFEQSDGAGAHPSASAASDVDLNRLSDIPMELSVEIGRTHMTVGETLDLRVGSVVVLERLSGETADLLVNGTAIARGEVVVVDEQYGLRITEILDAQHDPELTQRTNGAVDPVAATAADAAVDADGQPDAGGAVDAAADEARAADER